VKWAILPRAVARIVRQFFESLDAVGIRHSRDGSIFTPGSRGGFTLIDFATEDVLAVLPRILERDGILPDHVRRRWGQPAA
jgi:hypothetical protein